MIRAYLVLEQLAVGPDGRRQQIVPQDVADLLGRLLRRRTHHVQRDARVGRQRQEGERARVQGVLRHARQHPERRHRHDQELVEELVAAGVRRRPAGVLGQVGEAKPQEAVVGDGLSGSARVGRHGR